MTKAEAMAAALNEFLDVSWEVEAAAVISPDGLPMASALPPEVEEDRLAAMSASLLTLGEKASEGLDKGHLAQVLVEGDQGYVLLTSAGPDALLVAVMSHDAKVGLVLFEMRRAADSIAAVMDGSYRDASEAATATDDVAGDVPEVALDEEPSALSQPASYPEAIPEGVDEAVPQSPPAENSDSPAAPASDPLLGESGGAWSESGDDLRVEPQVQETTWAQPGEASREAKSWAGRPPDGPPEPAAWAAPTSDVGPAEPAGFGWHSSAEPTDSPQSSHLSADSGASDPGAAPPEGARSLWEPASGGGQVAVEPEREPEAPRGWRHWRSSRADSSEVSGSEKRSSTAADWFDTTEQDDSESSASAPTWK